MIKVATIAGSDASGGAGLEADLKTFEEYGLYGMVAVTLIATMNPSKNWSHEVFPIEEHILRAQMETIFNGVGVSAVKSGMLGTSYAVDLTAEYIQSYKIKNYILDPVMVCKGANEALNPELNQAVIEKLLPLSEIVTPNLFEASQIAGTKEILNIEDMKHAAKIIFEKGARNVFIKGGSKLSDATKAIDIFYDGKEFELLEEHLLKTNWTHGAGCTTAAAIASGIARGFSVRDSVVFAKEFVFESLSHGFALNKWVGPGNPTAWRTEHLYK